MDFKIIIENFFLLTLCLTTCLTLETFNYHHVKRISNYQEKDDYIVLIGEKAALPCNITKPNTESLLVAVLWYRDDSTNPIYTLDARSGRPEKMRNFVSESLKNRAFFNLSYPLSYLTIEPVTENDTGKYRCRVDFKRGRTFNHITNLNVTVKPRIVKIMNTPSVLLAGDQYELVCQATGSHPPGKITWTKEEGIQLNSSGESVSDDGLVISNFLTFVPSVEDNGKKLTCSATDDRFPNYIIHDSFLLTVNFIPILSLALGSSIQNKDIMEGSDVYFECNTQSNPPINRIGWFYNNEKLQSDDKLRIQVNNSSLLIRNVARSHSGKYQCWADNKVGKGQSDIVHLDVKYTPVCRSGQRIHYGVAKHEVAVIVCEVDADPSDVYFHWSFNSTINDDFREPEEIQFTVDGLKSVATYVPKRPIDYGVLYCSASNRVGKQSEPCLFFVIPAGSPDAPENCTLTNITAHTLTVECNPGYSGGYEQTFHLEVYINASGKKRLINNLTSSEYPFFIANALPAGNSFHLVTYASNNRGRSPIVTINGNTLVAERWQTDYFEETVVSTSILLLMGIVVTLVIIAIIVILVMKIRSDDDNARKDKSNLMDLSRISGNKQEILAQNCVNKQSLEYLEETWGPDLIPAQIALENSGFLTIPVITTTTSPEPGTIEAEIYDCDVHHQIITDHHHHPDHPTIITPHHHHHHHHRHTHETLDSPYYGNHCQIQLTTGVTTISPTTTTATITTGF